MKTTIIRFFIGFISYIPFSVSYAKVKLPALITSHVVLQQQTEVALWGESDRKQPLIITTSWNQKKYTTLPDKSGKWFIKVNTPKAGGPFQISFNDGDLKVIDDVLIGEVWVCSGQSNMEMPMRGFNAQPILNSNDIIAESENQSLRLFKIARATGIKPAPDCKGEWKSAKPETVAEFSAIAYQYGQILQKQLKVPVGLILSTVGGTMVETWMSKNSLLAFPEVKLPTNLDSLKAPHKEPTALFNGMINPIIPYGIKGFIWYQGESNRHEPELYLKLFPAMVANWRSLWNLGDLPFYYVQIAPYGSSSKTLNGPRLREAQLKAMSIIPNSGMIFSLDVGMEKYIHPQDKTSLAKRLSYWALAKTYGKTGIGYGGPIYKALAIKNDKITLTFDYATNGLTSFGKPLENFEIAGNDKVFYPATAIIDKDQIHVSSKEVKEPIAVRYAFKEFVIGDLYNTEGLPASSFRTDNWEF